MPALDADRAREFARLASILRQIQARIRVGSPAKPTASPPSAPARQVTIPCPGCGRTIRGLSPDEPAVARHALCGQVLRVSPLLRCKSRHRHSGGGSGKTWQIEVTDAIGADELIEVAGPDDLHVLDGHLFTLIHTRGPSRRDQWHPATLVNHTLGRHWKLTAGG